jgi:hypothetical protein
MVPTDRIAATASGTNLRMLIPPDTNLFAQLPTPNISDGSWRVSMLWDFLVYPVMREGGYVRYDGRKSTQVIGDREMLTARSGDCAKRRAVRENLRRDCLAFTA